MFDAVSFLLNPRRPDSRRLVYSVRSVVLGSTRGPKFEFFDEYFKLLIQRLSLGELTTIKETLKYKG